MKALVKLALISTFVISMSALAHSDGHGKADKNKIILAAQTLAKSLTFKDKGMSIGKLDSSWNKVAKGKFKLIEETQDAVIVKAENAEIAQTLYFSISKTGKVLDVKDAKVFEQGHGHAH